MTVCVAASTGSVVFCAADRLITAADIEFEGPNSKIEPITNSIVVMGAGDTGLNREIIDIARERAEEFISHSPEIPIPVSMATDWYVQAYNQIKAKRAEAAILLPLGQSLKSYAGTDSGLRDSVVEAITAQIQSFELPPLEAIVAGVDASTAHIFKIDRGFSRCEDAVGFSAIGNGAYHAESQFEVWPLEWNKHVDQTLFLTYLAKRRADEITPGVGKQTDMITIGPKLYSLGAVIDEALDKLPKLYNQVLRSERHAARRAATQMVKFHWELTAKQAQFQRAG